MNDEEIIKTIPEALKEFVYIQDGEVYAKQKLPVELEMELKKFQKRLKQPKCPNCGTPLMFLMPSGKVLNCDKCSKYFENDNGKVGAEISSPYTRKDILY